MKKYDFVPYQYQRDFGKTTPRMLEYLFNGGNDKETILKMCTEGLSLIDKRYDCSDFRVEKYIRVLYSFKDVIGKDAVDLITKSLFNFPFDDCSGNSMCTWTENHQLIFAASEYLLGQMYPNQMMYGNKLGKELKELAKGKLENWCEYIFKFGLSEFGSCNYYPETFAAIGNIIEFVDDDTIKNKYKMVLDIIVYDVLSTTLPNYTYNKATARAYVDNKVNFYNYMEPIIKSLLGFDITINKEREACFYLMLKAKDKNGNPLYKLPKVFKDIFETQIKVIKEANGLELKEYRKNNLLKYSEANALYALSTGALIDRRIVQNVVKYFDDHEMWQNAMLQPIRPFKNMILKTPFIFKVLKMFYKTSADDMAYGKGNTYTYINNNYSMSCLVNYHINKGSFQQVTNMINMDGLSVFTTSPSKDKNQTKSPDYWIGNFKNPDCKQYENTMFLMYNFNKSGYGKNKSHLYFPLEQFDKVNLENIDKGYLFGFYHGINIMIKTNPCIQLVDSTNDVSFFQDGKLDGYKYRKYDYMNCFKGNHYYIFRLDNTMDFDSFVNKSLNDNIKVKGKKIKYQEYIYKYNRKLIKDNIKQESSFSRFDSNFIKYKKYDYSKNKNLEFISSNNALILDFKNYTRKEITFD